MKYYSANKYTKNIKFEEEDWADQRGTTEIITKDS